tara:strand:- start:1131 stop:1316 length:186 start_codon:yes stop_codon:yes gene_type:complete
MLKFVSASVYVIAFHVAMGFFIWNFNDLELADKVLGTLIITGFCSLSAIRQIHEDSERKDA